MSRLVLATALLALTACSAPNPTESGSPSSTKAPALSSPTTSVPEGTVQPISPSSQAPAAAPSQLTPVPPDTIESPLGPSTVDSYQEMLRQDGLRVKWESFPVPVSFKSPLTATDSTVFAAFAAELSALSPAVSLSVSSSGPGIEVYFLPKSRWAEIGMDSPEMESVSGYTKTTFSDKKLLSAIVVVDDSLGQVARNRTLVHELLHAMGLGHNSCQGSMMYGKSGYDPDWKLSRYDATIFQAWYSPDPYATLELLPCPAVVWDTVRVQDEDPSTTIWCARSTNECFTVSPTTGPDLANGPSWWRTAAGVSRFDPAKFIQLNFNGISLVCEQPRPMLPYGSCTVKSGSPTVSYWYDGKVVYTYDPTKFKAYSVDNRRLLCVLPSASAPYAPCQFTEGSSVSVPDMYTDGTSVFKTPPK